MRIGLSCGFTLYHTLHSLRERRLRDLALYPLSGESTLKLVDIFATTLVGMMAAKYRPHVRAYALPVQHLLSLKEIERERRRLLRDPEVRSIYDAAQDVDIALAGVGVIAEQTPGFCALAESYGVSVKRLRQLGVVGEINYQPFDADGHVVDRPELRALSHRLLSVEGTRLQALSRRDGRSVIAVAGGKTKVDALRGALAGRFMNVLVTDEDAQTRQLGRRGAHGLRRLRRPGGITPEDRRAALGRDHGVDGVLEHQHAVAHADGQGAAAAALARHHGHDRRRQRRHAPQIARDRLRLAALL